MLYRLVRTVFGFALRLFYRIRLSAPLVDFPGPVILVGNHPNALIDPALIFTLSERQVTFLAKAPLFEMPVIGWIVKAMGALPVFRKKDDPGQMDRNEGTFEAATNALRYGGAIMLFPEGISHDLPHLAELKTGAARIALRAYKQGAKVRIIPVGLNYEQKHLFHSEVRVQPGKAIEVEEFAEYRNEDGPDSVRALTHAIAKGLAEVTLNLERWEDLPLIQTAEQLYAFDRDQPLDDPERRRLFAKGLSLFRAEDPLRYGKLQDALLSFRRRLGIAKIEPGDLSLEYRPVQVTKFVLENLLVLGLGLPLMALGFVLFWVPYQVPKLVTAAVANEELDTQGTVKFLTAFVTGIVWWAILIALGWWRSPLWAVIAFVGTIPFALFTLYMTTRFNSVVDDIYVFFMMMDRSSLKERLREQARSLTLEIAKVVDDYGPKVIALAELRPRKTAESTRKPASK